jgi:hypothetical protein
MFDSSAVFAKGFLMKIAHFALTLSVFMALTSITPVSAEEGGLFRHFVSFQFKEGTNDATKDELVAAFLELKNKIPVVLDLEWGGSENIEPLNDGFTHSFLVTFKDRAGLDTYLPHSAHEAFVKMLKPHLEKVYVFDYTAKQ